MKWNQNYYEQLIYKLDQFTRKYYINQLIRGSLYFVGLLTIVFIAFNLLENQFYFSKLVRKILFFSFLGLFLGTFWHWIIRPTLHYFRLGRLISHDEAARIIGTHFTDVKDKLLNVLQLKSQSIGYTDQSLFEASINQKAADLRPVPFVSAIDLQKNRKYLQYAFLPLLLLGGLMIWNPDIIKNPTARLIKNNQEFEKAAAFTFVLPNDKLQAEQNQDYTLQVQTDGSVVPAEAFIEVDHFQYRMHQDEPGVFSYTFRNVQQKQNFQLVSGDIKSKEYSLDVLMLPLMEGFELELQYPAYTGRKNETLQNIGDLNVPVGTIAVWKINALHTDDVSVRFDGKSTVEKSNRRGENEFQFSHKILHDANYTIFLNNQHISRPDSIQYLLSVIPDNYPVINAQVFTDSSDAALVYFAGDVSDDYGLKNLNFHYIIRHKSGQEDPLQSKSINSFSNAKSGTFRHQFDMNELNMEAGDHVSYYFEIWDNDAVNGSKSTKSSIQDYRIASENEMENKEEKNSEDIKDNLEKSIAETQKLKDKLAEFKDKMRQQKDLDWNNKKDLDKMMKEQEKIQRQFEEAKKKYEENLKNQQQHSNPDEKLLEKQEQLQKLMNESMSDEMKKLMDEIQKMMQELNKDQAIQMSEKFEMKNKDMAKEMDRLLELFKELELEKTIKEQADKLKLLAEEQKKLADKTEENKAPSEELKKEQEDINKKFDELKKKQEDIKKKNESLEKPKPMADQKKNQEDISKDMKDAKDKLDKKENKPAAKSQKDAAEKMEKMAEEMEQEQEENEKDENAEDIKMIRQLLENLVSLSFEQESLIKSFGDVNTQTPKYTALVQDEFRLKENFKHIDDSLQELSKRVVQIKSFVLDKVSEVNDNFSKTIENLEARNVAPATGHQQRIMKNVNDLAVMLAESLDQKQKESNASCKKPGGGSCSKPKKKKSSSSCKNPGSGKSGKVPMDKITESQSKLEQGMKGMSDKMKSGQEGTSKEFAEMAAKQAQLRKMLQDLEKERKEQGNGSQQMQDIINEMNKTEKELVNKQLTNEALKRQAEITTKLLDAERAEREREYKEERKSESGTNIERVYPPSLEEYLKLRQAETEWFQHISPDLRPFYKKLVENYYQGLKK